MVVAQWGWPQPDGTVGYYYPGAFQEILSEWYVYGMISARPAIDSFT